VILANPPFMSPKGGIRPHKRFSIQSNRSEVLFVDYMVEHLTPTGRAAIIVPEGVIFQSGTAYKSLRKMLVDENYLVGVISLPAGLFNPYSGVKTSILWIDKSLARKTDKIIFAKITADGFDLGAQRRPVKQNDLPDAFRAINQYIDFLQTGSMPVGPIHDDFVRSLHDDGDDDDFVRSLHDDGDDDFHDDDFVRSLHATTPPETSINPESLQSDASPVGTLHATSNNAGSLSVGMLHDDNGDFVRSLHATTPPETSNNPESLQSDASPGETMQTGISPKNAASVGMLHDNDRTLHATSLQQTPAASVRSLHNDNGDFVRSMHDDVRSLHATTPQIAPSSESTLQSIYPNISLVSKSDIAENGDYNLGGERYKTNNIETSTFEIVTLKEVCEILNGRAYKQEELLDKGKYPVMRVGNFFSNRDWYYSDLELDENKYCIKGDLLFAWSASFGPRIWDGEKCVFHYHIWKMVPDESRINKKFLYHVLDRETQAIKTEGGRGIAMIHITKAGMEQRKIPLPPLSIQQEIVTEIESYQKIIDGARQVVENYKPRITIDPDWEMVELSEVCKIKGGYAFQSSDYTANGIQLIRMGNVKSMFFDYQNSPSYLPENFKNQYPNFLLKKDDLLISMTGTIGKEDYGNVCRIDIDGHFLLNQRVGKFEINKVKLDASFIYYFANSEQFRKSLFGNSSGGVRQANISNKGIENIIIPLPPLQIQRQIVAQIEREQALVNANKELIRLFEQKVKDRIARVWGEDVPKIYPTSAEELDMVAEPE
jgi:type I restriction enzyme M protein